MMQWFEDISGKKIFDPDSFKANAVKFSNAKKRLKKLKE